MKDRQKKANHISITDWKWHFSAANTNSDLLTEQRLRESAMSREFAISINSKLIPPSAPFKTNHHAIVLGIKGSCQITVGHHSFAIQRNSIVFHSPSTITSFGSISDDFSAHLVVFNKDFLAKSFVKESILDELLCPNPEYPPVFEITTEYLPFIQRKFVQVDLESQSQGPFHLSMIRLLILELLYDYNRVCEHCLLTSPKRMNRQYQLTYQFKHLVENYFIQRRTVTEYADLLHISAKYLSEIVKEELGVPALDVIHNRIILEAQYLLKYTKFSIKEIACQLCFDTTSHFARFFKGKLNITPLQYRNQLDY